jgi:[ribosomal protein S5]-alanine N-acetyltransferase
MTKLLESDRLILRPWSFPIDNRVFHAIYNDPEVTRFMPTIRELAASVEEFSAFFSPKLQAVRERYNGTDWWALVNRATGEAIGTVILQNLPDNEGNPTPDIEIGWHLSRSHWGRGYATEAAQTILEYGFQTLQLPVIYAVVHPDNDLSRRVTERLGMRAMGRTHQYHGVELSLFALEPAS